MSTGGAILEVATSEDDELGKQIHQLIGGKSFVLVYQAEEGSTQAILLSNDPDYQLVLNNCYREIGHG